MVIIDWKVRHILIVFVLDYQLSAIIVKFLDNPYILECIQFLFSSENEVQDKNKGKAENTYEHKGILF